MATKRMELLLPEERRLQRTDFFNLLKLLAALTRLVEMKTVAGRREKAWAQNRPIRCTRYYSTIFCFDFQIVFKKHNP